MVVIRDRTKSGTYEHTNTTPEQRQAIVQNDLSKFDIPRPRTSTPPSPGATLRPNEPKSKYRSTPPHR